MGTRSTHRRRPGRRGARAATPAPRVRSVRSTVLLAMASGVVAVLVGCSVTVGPTGSVAATSGAATGATSDAEAARAEVRRAGPATPDGPLPTVRVAPYVDLTTPPVPDLAAAVAASGQRDLVLAFVLAGPRGCAPTWGGTTPLGDPLVAAQVGALRARGGTTTLSSGGAIGRYLETSCPDAASLARAYATALDAVGTDHLDVDIETDAGRDVDLDRVAEALAILQRDRGTRITLTLQIEDAATGMTEDAVDLVRAVTDRGVATRVNLMTMNFDDDGAWSAAMVGAVDASVRQLTALWPGSTDTEIAGRVGVTYMIGRNDTDATTQLDDAAVVVDAARTRGLGYVGFWSFVRDNGGCPGTADEADECSGVVQPSWAFSRGAQAFA